MPEVQTKICQNCKSNFTIEPDDFAFYEKIKVPPPTFCSQCRLIRRLSWIGYKVLYKRACNFTGDQVITFYHPSTPYKVYRQDIWWSDKWNPKDYGRDYDFRRPFFEQFDQLLRSVPLPALQTQHATLVDSEYCNGGANLKSCYMCFMAGNGEHCAYINSTSNTKECLDVIYAIDSELCYDSLNISKCYQTFYSQDCSDSHDIYFSRDLIGCSNCVGCINLRNKNHYIFNAPYTKEEYEKKLAEYSFGSMQNVERFKKEIQKFFSKFPRRSFYGRQNTDVSGDYIFNSKNVHDSYMVYSGEDMRYCQLLKERPSAESYDYTMFGMTAEWIYECCWTGINASNVKFGFWNYTNHDVEYCFGCHSSSNLFGCVGIRNGSYCILNKQYSKDEYEVLTARIKQQMIEYPYRDRLGSEYRYGEFFPSEISPWTYNESRADEFFPKTKDEALERGFTWRDRDSREYQVATMKIPDKIEDVHDDILQAILKCTDCGRNYKVVQMELNFYRRLSIPIPQRCFFCRDHIRFQMLNPIKTYNRRCAKCGADIKTSYAPDRPEIVYCEQCYQAEVA